MIRFTTTTRINPDGLLAIAHWLTLINHTLIKVPWTWITIKRLIQIFASNTINHSVLIIGYVRLGGFKNATFGVIWLSVERVFRKYTQRTVWREWGTTISAYLWPIVWLFTSYWHVICLIDLHFVRNVRYLAVNKIQWYKRYWISINALQATKIWRISCS